MRIWRTTNRLINAAILLVFLPWFAYFAYVRATTPPRGTADAADDRKRHDAGVRMRSAVTTLPPFDYKPTTPRIAWSTSDMLYPALHGGWDAARRPFIGAISAYLNRDEVARVLDEIVDRAAKPYDASASRAYGFVPNGPRKLRALTAGAEAEIVSESEITTAGLLLLCRSRQRQSVQDYPRAAADIASALKLLSNAAGDSPGLIGLAQTAARAANHLASEVALDRTSAANLIAALRGHTTLSVADALLRAWSLMDWRAEIDRHYSLDDSGGGWLVINSLPAWTITGSVEPRSSLWNAGAPLFRGRREIIAKVEFYLRRIRDVDSLTAKEAEKLIAAFPYPLFDSRDGPFLRIDVQSNRHAQLVFAYQAVHVARAAIIMCALSVFGHDNGAYPATIDALRPEYVDEIPISLITQRPFAYSRLSESAYTLTPSSVSFDDMSLSSGEDRGPYQSLSFPMTRMPAPNDP